MHEILQKIGEIGIVPVIKIDHTSKALGLGKALVDGWLPVAEVTFRTEAAEESIRILSSELPELIVGAGTVINVELAKKAISAGAKFIVSPGFNPEVVDFCLSKGIPVLPGVNNPSTIEAALLKGLKFLKFFPAEPSGGVTMIDALTAPFVDIKFIPTGGIDPSNLAAYAKREKIHAVGGSWMVKADLINDEKWDVISGLCREAVTLLQGFSFAHVGINSANENEAKSASALLAAFGFPPKEGNSSVFNGTPFEVMKSPFRGSHGHIAIKTYNVERALAYLKRFGFNGVPETAKEEKGRLKVIYLDKEINGFAVHLVRD